MTQPRQSAPPPPTRKRSPLPWIILSVFVVALGVVLVPKLLNSEDDGPLPVAAAEQDPLLVAVDKCDPAKEGVKLADRNRKLIINGSGEKFPVGLKEDAMNCVLEACKFLVFDRWRVYKSARAKRASHGAEHVRESVASAS